MIIEELSPLFFIFFEWDLKRRNWKHAYDDNKLNYLQKIANQIDQEMAGESPEMLIRYTEQLLDFFQSKIDEYLLNPAPILDNEEFSSNDLFESRNQIMQTREKIKMEFAEDSGLGKDIIERYLLAAGKFKEGLLQHVKRFDYIFYAFVDAQNDYKRMINSIIRGFTDGHDSIHQLTEALNKGDVPEFIQKLKVIYASVPNTSYKKRNEDYFQVIFHVVLILIGCSVESEVSTNLGRIDIVIDFPELVYIIELKLSDADAAMKQILEKKYYERYQGKGKRILLLGLAFDPIARNISEKFELKELVAGADL